MQLLPPRVRMFVYLNWVGLVLAGLGVLGFMVSFWEVGSAAAAVVDVHETVPVLAYASIAAWIVGLALMWYSRRRIDAAVAAKLEENRARLLADSAAVFADDDAPDGREG